MNEKTPEKSLEEILSELDEYMEMFETAGWQRFISVTKDQLQTDQENAYLTHRTNEEWQNLRGHIALAKRIIGFEDLVRAQIDQVNEAIEERDLAEQEKANGEVIDL